MDRNAIEAALRPVTPAPGELSALCDALAVAPMPALRLNRLGAPITPADLPYPMTPINWYPNSAYRLTEYHRLAANPLFGTGAWFIQDAGSLLAVRLLDVRPGELVLDLCAAPGGKSTAILEALGTSGALLANEAVRSRLGALLLNLARHGAWRYLVSNRDPQQLADTLGDCFDAVLVDAPCTAQTLLALNNQAAQAFDPRRIEHCAARQKRILHEAARLVKPGGRLVYATCTYSFLENEQQVKDFLAERPDFQPVNVPDLDVYRSGHLGVEGCYRLWPHRNDGVGAFAARMVRTDTPDRPPGHAQPLIASRIALQPVRKLDFDWNEWGRWKTPIECAAGGYGLFAMPDRVPQPVRRIARSAPEVAFRKGTTWFPAYALAMRRDGAFRPNHTTDLNPDQARAYLEGAPLEVPVAGWTVATFLGRALGWAKGNGRILSNHLPKPARLIPEPPS